MLDWPANPFWDYSLALYRRPGVETACLDLQRRHGIDVNLVLLCCWLAERGTPLDDRLLARLSAAVDEWQSEVVRPLRAVRRRLKAMLEAAAGGPAVWSDLARSLRERILALEIDGERLEQLRLAEVVAGEPPVAVPGLTLAASNLRRYRRFTRPDREALETLLCAAFPGSPADEVEQALGGLIN